LPSVVVLIFHHSGHMKWFEEISLLQCFKVLGDYPIRLVCPEGTNLDRFKELVPNIEVDPVPANWMSSILEYNRMKVSPALYRRYQQYDYMLTYELDAFVFRDELSQWCDTGYDYIGAPWITFDDSNQPQLGEVGNSGFSLRNIQTALNVMDSFGWVKSPWLSARRSWSRGDRLQSLGKLIAMTSLWNNTHRSLSNFFFGHEDAFWSNVGYRRPYFKMPESNDALKFSFEVEPQYLYGLNDQALPFGCHAWQKYQLGFWKPHVEAFGYSVPEAEKVEPIA